MDKFTKYLENIKNSKYSDEWKTQQTKLAILNKETRESVGVKEGLSSGSNDPYWPKQNPLDLQTENHWQDNELELI